jgi:hypothetical protein
MEQMLAISAAVYDKPRIGKLSQAPEGLLDFGLWSL